MKPKRILFATVGSLGDLHPCMALALELIRRGHTVTIAATEFYRDKVEAEGIGFSAMRPNWRPDAHELIRQCEDLRSGPEVLFRKLILPELRNTYEDLRAAAADADLMVAGELVYAAPLIAEKLGKRWVSLILSPSSFFSAHDPSVLVNAPGLIHLRKVGWWVYRLALNLARVATWHWWQPVRELRQEEGLRARCDPLFRDKFSPDLVLALFSEAFAGPQPDWPKQTRQPGFVFFEHKVDDAVRTRLRDFLDGQEPPLVFALGSTAVAHPGSFYKVSVEAARALRRRAILVGAPSSMQGEQVLVLPYAPYSEVFPHAAVIVHQGGSGTTGEALRAGRPMLVVPYGWDQPDNGARVQRLGAGLALARSEYTATAAVRTLQALLHTGSFARKAEQIDVRLREEAAVESACDEIEAVLSLRSGGSCEEGGAEVIA